MKKIAAFVFALSFAAGAWAVEPQEMLKDPTLETRARDVSKIMRCVVCQKETIDESNADIARDMRVLIRARILAGDSNDQVIAFLVNRYGDYILLRPRFIPGNFVLWLGPFGILLLGAGVVVARLRNRASPAPAPLTPQEQADLAALTDRDRTGDITP